MGRDFMDSGTQQAEVDAHNIHLRQVMYITQRIIDGCIFPFWGVCKSDKEWYIKEVLKHERNCNK